jgi:CubicO group peptidase (beta-lactamase class C family)
MRTWPSNRKVKLVIWLLQRLLLLSVLVGAPAIAQRVAEDQRAVENHLSTGLALTGVPAPPSNVNVRMKALHVHGAGVALIHKGRIEWAAGYGERQANGPAVDISTLFNFASVSKAVTAVAVMRLAQDGRLDLDRDVNSYLRRWNVPQNQWTRQRVVTTRMILNHTAGFGESYGHVYSPSNMPTLLQQLDGRPSETDAPVRVKMLPGSRFEYSSPGYLALELLIEDVTGMSFADAMQSLVFTPLGMEHSTFVQPLSAAQAENAASAFGGRQTIGMAPEQYVITNLPAGGLWSTPTDVAKLALEIRAAALGKPAKVLSRSSARAMLKPSAEGFPHAARGKLYQEHERWGLGLELAGSSNHPFFDHAGGGIYESFMFLYMNGDGLVATTNYSHGSRLIHELLASASSVYHWPDFQTEEHPQYPLSDKDADALVGTYADGIRVERSEAGLIFQMTGEQSSDQMLSWSPTRFILAGRALELNFELSATTHRATAVSVRSQQDSFQVARAQ